MPVSYCVPSDVTAMNKLFQTPTFTDTYVQSFIDKSVARLNNLLQPHYMVPLVDPIPDIIKSITVDMAASLLCETHFSDRNYKENVPWAEVYRKRAQADIEHVLEHSTLDECEGVVKRQPDAPEMRRKVASSTPHQDCRTKNRLKEFDWATRSPLSNVREWP